MENPHGVTVRTEVAGGGSEIRTVREMLAVRAMIPSDWPTVARIYAEGIATGVATFETDVPGWEEWDAAHRTEPRFVADDDGEVIGWIAVSPVSRRDAYRGVVEHSVYVSEAARGAGVGRVLLDALVAAARDARDLDDPDLGHRGERGEPRIARGRGVSRRGPP